MTAKIRILIFSLFLIILLASCVPSAGLSDRAVRAPAEAPLAEPKNVLYISSYSADLFTFEEQRRGIREGFTGQPVYLHSEFMDTKNFPEGENLENFKRSLAYKLEKGREYDAVIVGDDNGLRFLMENKEELFPDTPVFFLGINDRDNAVRSQRDPLVTGVVEAKSIGRSLDLAMRIIPGAKRIVSLVDDTTSSQAEYAHFTKYVWKYPEQEFIVINISDGSFSEFFDKAAALGPTDIVFWLSAVTDSEGNAMTYDEMLPLLSRVVKTPLFGFTTFGIGEGILGGCVISHVDQGFAAAEMVMEYFNGKPMDEIYFSTNSPNANYIDYRLYRNFGFPPDRLPEDTVLINRPDSFWEQYGKTVMAGTFIILLEFVIIFFLVSNILLRRKSESALRENEAKFRSYIENAPDGIFIVNGEGTLLDVNNSGSRLTGFPRGELLNCSLYDYLQEDYKENARKGFAVLKEKDHIRGELGVITKSREKRFWDVDLVGLPHDKYLGFAKDITLRIEAQEKKEALEEQLQHSRRMDAIGQLAGGVAHDFNNTLSVIMGTTEIILSSGEELTGETSELLGMVMKSSRRAADLNSKLLAFGRVGKVSRSDVDINEIVDDTLVMLEQTIDRKIGISARKGAEKTRVVGDSAALQSSLLNLCINATHAMPGGGELTIATGNVSLDEDFCEECSFEVEAGEFIRIEVRDTGTGIDPEVLPRIFEPFFTTKEKGKGSGLGLSAVYGTIQDHRGAIRVDSKPGSGTVFQLTIPCSEAESA